MLPVNVTAFGVVHHKSPICYGEPHGNFKPPPPLSKDSHRNTGDLFWNHVISGLLGLLTSVGKNGHGYGQSAAVAATICGRSAMTLFLSLFPVYLLGNLHCLGMCGPLVMMLGQNPYRYFYFFGRLISYALAGFAAGELGALIHLVLQTLHLAAAASFLFGLFFLVLGIAELKGNPLSFQWLQKKLEPLNRSLSLLLLKEQPWPAFLFGFFTVFLPCGQTLLVFSACALYGDGLAGLINGAAFALLTSPSLLAAMQLHTLLHRLKRYYRVSLACCALLVAGLAICRGMAEMGWIPHLVLSEMYHVVIY